MFFTVAVAIENATHTQIKKEMRGIKGFRPNSHYGMCFRVAMIRICQKIEQFYPEAKVAFILEDGNPGAGDAATTYADVKQSQHFSWGASQHAHMLAGFGLVPKGACRTLEAADFLAGRALLDVAGPRPLPTHAYQVGPFLDCEFLLEWHQDMLDEKDRRRAHYHRPVKKPVSSEKQSS